MGGSHGMLVSGCSLQALKHGAAANNIRGRSLKIELMQQWRPFPHCRMRITVGGQEEGNAWQCDGQVAWLLWLYTYGELWVAPEENDKDTANQGYPHLPTKSR
uniref:Uncharacterized protein n=1 Tax=Coccidioides posadasii RMSCC 3488 TaxID=454284 RepID=A0A0J6FM61_COCPO|nr:hypothetical protein CPAG_07770 [Coccidioides posadasii RMSCC 3488]